MKYDYKLQTEVSYRENVRTMSGFSYVYVTLMGKCNCCVSQDSVFGSRAVHVKKTSLNREHEKYQSKECAPRFFMKY